MSVSVELSKLKLCLSVAATGAAVMVIEIVGTRVLGPVFGASLYVWAALLSVTLCSLAIGYYFGGSLVDRRPTGRLMALVPLVSSICLACQCCWNGRS